jgi:hypothetical protein
MSFPLPQLPENKPPFNLPSRVNQQGYSVVLPIFVITMLAVLGNFL